MRPLRYACWAYVALLAVAIISDVVLALTTQYGVRTGLGCNFYDALVVGVECKGFGGAKVAELFFNWPLWLVYGPRFGLMSLQILLVGVLAWAPLPIFLSQG